MIHCTYLITNQLGDTRIFCVTAEHGIEADQIVIAQLEDGESFECIEYEDADW